MTDLFSSPVLRVEQPRRAPSARSQYKVYDGAGTLLASAAEQGVPMRRQAYRTFFGEGDDRRAVYVESGQGVPLLVLEKPKAARGAAGTWVSTPDGRLVGSVRMDRYRYQYVLLDAADRPAGRLEGNRLARKFRVLDGHGHHVAQVDKKWKGAATEVLTTADKYSVEIFRPLADPLRVLVAAAPIAIDLMLYEGKDFPVPS
ncbi:phospholipid scramblase-related protein [Actinomadura sp. 9N407]|uniref:phospholipid scramblase-related protein n=1 Tax=Actinomadura sp. 9N407 TaxID=3375154 RepID=UPI00378F9324